MGYYRRFPDAIPHLRVRSIAFLALPPVSTHRSELLPQLACFNHADSVQAEPGSNSSIDFSMSSIPLGFTSTFASASLRSTEFKFIEGLFLALRHTFV